tara:strand:- start:1130 stop:1333 length:204 start_codon:yes stop_codon:yes gene_type:complete
MILQNSIENDNININKSDVLEFIEIRDSGEYNMYNPVVRKMIGLDKREYKYLLNNFDEICNKYELND